MAKSSTTLFSGTVTTASASVNGTAAALDDALDISAVILQLSVTAAAAAAGDTLDVKVQTSFDGTAWIDVCWFTQLLGNGGVKTFLAKLSATEPQTMFATSTALTAGNIRHLIGTQWRVNYALVDGGAHGQSFTFAVTATPN
jgi:hypothetical protein